MVGSMANPRLRSLPWWRRWTKNDWAIAAVGFTVIAFALTLLSSSRRDKLDSGISSPFLPNAAASDLVELTLLKNAKDRGALCLDGTAPGYHFRKGFGSGANNWLLHIEGGGWCNSTESCSWRKGTPLGSSNYMDRLVSFSGILSSHPSQNPEFFNWNKVRIRYCDGASLAGHPENESKNGSELFFRGQLIWEAVIDELLSIGMSKVKQALLSGCSAGGLATLIHCDDFRGLLPKDATVKCLADGGFFLDEIRDLSKWNTNVTVQHVLIPEAADPHGYWKKCKLNIHNCNSNQLEILQGFRGSMLKALNEFQKNMEGGMFINSCYIHCQTDITETWHSPTSPRINNKTIAESVGDWYFSRNVVKQIDCPFPCNPTCYHMNLTALSPF